MSKVLEASCLAGVVTVDGLPMVDATVLSEGAAQSSGIAVLDEEQVWYLPKGSPDLKTTLDTLVSILTNLKTAIDKIADTFTDVGSGMAGSGTAPPPTLPASVTAIKASATAINTLKGTLNSLKGAMI